MSQEAVAAYLDRFQASKSNSDDQPDPGPESKLQAKCEDWLRARGWPFFHDRSRKKNKRGIPDLVIFAPGAQVILIELKAKGGRLSDEQIRFRQTAGLNGHVVYECRSFKKFKEIVDGRNREEAGAE
jgi:hypothetical protein